MQIEKSFPSFKDVEKIMLGFDPVFEQLRQAGSTAVPNYPPFNVFRVGQDQFVIEIACAGFTKEELHLDIESGYLTVVGKRQQNVEPAKNYVYKGIAFRDFERKFVIADNTKVTSAELENGLLTIVLDVEKTSKKTTIEIK